MLDFFEEVFEHPDQSNNDFLSIENCEMVRDKASAVHFSTSMSGYTNGAMCKLEVDDVVQFPVATKPKETKGYKNNLVHDEGWNFNATENRKKVSAVIGPAWHVESRGKPSGESLPEPEDLQPIERELWMKLHKYSSSNDALGLNEGLSRQNFNRKRNYRRSRGRGLRSSHHTNQSPSCSSNKSLVHAGDICVILRSTRQSTSSSLVGLFIASLMEHASGGEAERILWFHAERSEANKIDLHVCANCVVTDLPTLLKGRENFKDHQRLQRNKGFLETGERYVIYRIAVYHDGFKQFKSLSDHRSVGGCYLLPLGLTSESRRTTAAPRVITIAPHGIQSNEVISLIVQDIVQASTKGVSGMDAKGRKVRIFIDPLSTFADYPAAAQLSDSLGQSANSFCLHCCHRRLAGRSGTKGPEIIHTSTINSARLGFVRTNRRIELIRESNENEQDLHRKLNILGCKPNTTTEPFNVVLSKKLRESAEGVPLNSSNEFVLDPRFDANLSQAVVPDHAFFGVATSVLQLSFFSLPSNEDRRRFQSLIISAGRENGLPLQGNFLRWRDNKFLGFHSITMSSTFIFLFLASHKFMQHYATGNEETTTKDAMILPFFLQELVIWCYTWPNAQTDDIDSCLDPLIKDKYKYNAELLQRLNNFIKSASAVVNDAGEEAKKLLDRPNFHRVIELCVHSIPKFGHVRNFSEMSLELHHQVFKKWIEKNPHPSSHISAVERALTRDWLTRVYQNYRKYKSEGLEKKYEVKLSLMRLLMGRCIDDIEISTRSRQSIVREFDELLEKALNKRSMRVLKKCFASTGQLEKVYGWDAVGFASPLHFKYKSVKSALISNIRGEEVEYVAVGREKARYSYSDKYDGHRKCYAYNTVRTGSVVSAKVCAEKSTDVTLRTDIEDGEVRYYVILQIMESGKGLVWVTVYEMMEVQCGSLGAALRKKDSRMKLLKLDSTVRRAACIHKCTEGCKVENTQVIHTKGILDGGLYTIVGRRGGFPPNLG